MSKLVVMSEEMKGRTFELAEERITVGRLPDNILRLEDKAISSHHAELILKGGDYLLRDLNSTNGTRVNGQRIIESRLCHGDMVSFGHLELQYLSSTKGIPQPLPPPNKKTVDLSGAVTAAGTSMHRPTSYRSASPFSRQKRSTSKLVLQAAFIVLGIAAVALLAIFINWALSTGH